MGYESHIAFVWVLIGIIPGLAGVYQRLKDLAYEKTKIFLLLLTILVVLFPSASIGSRLFNMLYYPASFWNYRFFWDQFQLEPCVTFHTSFLFCAAMAMVVMGLMRLKIGRTLDVFALYLPLSQSLAGFAASLSDYFQGQRLPCLPSGFIHEKNIMMGLVEAAACLVLFFILRWFYRQIVQKNSQSFDGMLFSVYCVFYGNLGLCFENQYTNLIFHDRVTPYRLVMLILIGIGLILFFALTAGNSIARHVQDESKRKSNLALLGFVTVYLPFTALFTTLLVTKVVAWPFRKLHTWPDVISAVLTYTLYILFALSTFIWMKKADLPIRNLFHRPRFTPAFIAGLIVSSGVTIYLLMRIHFRFDAEGIWSSVILFSALNAFSEEVVFRGALYRLLKNLTPYPWLANFLQALCYATQHFYPAGLLLALAALLYGLLLGYVMEKNENLTSVIICHFVIDLGMLGLAILGKVKVF